MTAPLIFTYSDPQSMANALASEITRQLQIAVSARGQACLMLPGGSSPALLINELTKNPVPWGEICVLTTDERCVPFESEESNAGAIYRLLKRNSIAANVQHLVEEKQAPTFPWPADVCVLGMGVDGHFASIFPGSKAINANAKALKVIGSKQPADRITYTLKSLMDSRNLILLVTTAEKWRICEKVLAEHDPDIPVSSLFQRAGERLEIHRSFLG